MPFRTTKAQIEIVAALKARAQVEAGVILPIGDLARAHENVRNASEYLFDFIERKIASEGHADWDAANETSHDLSELMFILMLIEDGQFSVDPHIVAALTLSDPLIALRG